ncbi:uncharacterized protein TRUGW13939_04692 [Talaromyces rugulosus]|uniref:CWH43-like N-terminal domain-containing protein n=1 Tax=Talaromyces rugulosus TaxID=121627 RepID=A0A7H8QU91_TALRU|nr:uncharacterized protein TRUGW13939_04692 [Talaromyces rugulosus]QKX57574.1 hypothetical protein TRUGW13939_04692 [Talaromyces rugulosus]
MALTKLRQWAFVLPTITVSSWLAMLAALFSSWYTSGEPRYASEEDTQKIAFISDIGAQSLKPLFIICTSLSMATYIPSTTLYFLYMSPSSDAIRDSSSSSSTASWKSVHSIWTRIVLPLLSTLLSLIGATALILLTIFDTARYPSVHRSLLSASITTHVVGCGLLCGWSFVRIRQHRQITLSNHDDDDFVDKFSSTAVDLLPISKPSLAIKSIFVAAEFALVALFAIMTWWLKRFDIAAIMEWAVVLMFAGYMACLIGDLWGARVEIRVEQEVDMPIGVAI